MSDLVKELEALDAKATKGPWWLRDGNNIMSARSDVAEVSITGASSNRHSDWHELDTANAMLVIALRNALPAIIEYVKAVDALRQWSPGDGQGQLGRRRLAGDKAEHALLAALRGGK